jgi:PAS domain S-box-containing protein
MPQAPFPIHALVVESDPLAAELLQRGLEDIGFTVSGVAEWTEAWGLVQQRVPRLVVAPLAAEIGAAQGGIRRVRGLEQGRRAVFLATHTRPMRPDRQTMLDIGIDDFLAYPIDPDELEVRLAIAKTRVLERQAADDPRSAQGGIHQAMARSDEATVIAALDEPARAFRIVSVNAAFERMTGYSGDAVAGRTHRVLVETKDSEALLQCLRESVQQNRAASIRVHGLRQDGRSFPVEWSITPVPADRAGPSTLLCILRPAASSADSMQQLRAAEEKFRNIVDVSIQGVLVHQDWKLRFVNRTLAELLGYPDAEAVLAKGRLEALVAPEDQVRLKNYNEARKRGHAPEHYELEMVRRDGTRIALEGFVRQVSWEGEPAVLASYVDVTERKRAQTELQSSKALLEAVFDAIPHNVYVKDREGIYLAINRAVTETWRRPAGEIIGSRFASAEAPSAEARAAIDTSDGQVLREGSRSDTIITRAVPPRGMRRFRAIKVPLRDAAGTVVGLVGISEDVTERLNAEEELRRSRALLQAVFDTIPHDVFVKDRQRRFVAINAAMGRTWQRPPESVPSAGLQRIGTDLGDERKVIEETDRKVLEDGLSIDRVIQRTMLSGGVRRFRLIKRPLLDATGAIVGLVGLAEDITERLAAEEALRRSQALLHTIFDTIPHGLYMKDREGRFLIVNRQLSSRWGLQPEEMIGKRMVVTEHTTPEEERAVLASDERILRTGENDEYTLARTMADGSLRQIRYVKAALRDSAGEVTGIVGIAEDISERKQAEEALRQSEERFRRLIEESPYGILIHQNQAPLYVNPAFARIFGFDSPAEVLALDSIDHWVAEEELARVRGYADSRLRQDTSPPETYEFRGRKKDGTLIWVQNSVRAVDWEGQRALQATMMDVTERKTAEAELAASQRLLRTLIDSLPQSIHVKDTRGRYQVVNLAMARTHAVSVEHLLGSTISDVPLRQGERAAQIQAAEERAMREDKQVEIAEMPVERPDHSLAWERLIKVPLHDESGTVIGVVGIAEDITVRKKIEDELRDSQHLLQTVFDTLPQSLSLKDPAGRYVLVNRAFLKRNNVTPEQVYNKTPEVLPRTSSEHARLIQSADAEVIEKGTVVELPELRFGLTDGSQTWVRIIKAPFRDSAGRVSGIVSIAEDLTSRRQIEDQLRDSQRLLQTVMNALPQSIYVKDLKGTYQLVNSAVIKRHGLSAPAILDDAMGEIATGDPGVAEQVRQGDSDVLRTGSMVEVGELRVSPADRPAVWMRVIKTPLRNDQGNIVGIITIADDITARKQAEAERLELERQILHSQKLESLGVLAGGIAHDFNNLLTGILGNVELAVMDTSADHPAAPTLQQIKQASLRAAALTQQMLAYSGRGRLQVRAVDLSALVEEMAQLLKVSISKKIAMRFDLARDLPAVEGDPTQLQQIVMNLITNASEAIGDTPGAIHLSTGRIMADRAYLSTAYLAESLDEGEYVFMEVVDTGAGMDADVQARIFDPFFTTKFTGRGLGLAAVLGIVRGHHGTIHIQSAPGKGSTFRILLPASRGTARPVKALQEPPPSAWRGTGTILVVDDEPIVRSVMQRQLKSLGFDVIAVSGGRDAVIQYQTDPKAIVAVLLDLTMPDLGGVETLRELKRIRPDVRIIVCSGYSEQDAAEQFKGDAPDGFLQKPTQFEDLARKLQEILG